MQSFEKRIESLDPSLFEAIPSQTSDEDRASLLKLQHLVRNSGPYIYLEIGSHLGGTIQPHYADPLCQMIVSIDKRPLSQPDERGINFEYHNNSTDRMLNCLQNAFPEIHINKIRTYDCESCSVGGSEMSQKPDLLFIDGEHTNRAVYSDFMFCVDVCDHNAIIALHDATVIFKGIHNIKKYLIDKSIRFKGIMLGGSVYAVLFNHAIEMYAGSLEIFKQNEAEVFSRAKTDLFRMRLRNKRPTIRKFYNFILKGRNG
jgi:hypothetical protein